MAKLKFVKFTHALCINYRGCALGVGEKTEQGDRVSFPENSDLLERELESVQKFVLFSVFLHERTNPNALDDMAGQLDRFVCDVPAGERFFSPARIPYRPGEVRMSLVASFARADLPCLLEAVEMLDQQIVTQLQKLVRHRDYGAQAQEQLARMKPG